MQMQHVINNTKNNMFKDKHLMWKTIALVLCIKIPHTKSNLLRIYTYIYIHIYIYATYTYIYMHIHIQFICILLCPRVYTQSHIYISNWYSMCLVIMGDFSLLILQNSGKVIKFKGHFYFKRTML